jgi:hypothetical protein
MSERWPRDPGIDGTAKIFTRNAPLLFYLFTSIWLIAWFVHGYGYWEDDAFIHLEFARSLYQGHGFAFDGVVTYGDTSPMWVFLLVGSHYLISDWMVAGKLLMVLSCVAALSALDLLARKLAPTGIAPQMFAAVIVLLLATNPYFVYWLSSGMETILAIAIGLWIMWLAADPPLSWINFWLGCFLCGLAPLLRPEFVFLGLVVSPFLILKAWRLSSRSSFGARVAVLMVAGLLAIGPLAAWMVYAHEVFGTVISNTSAAKRELGNGSVLRRLLLVLCFGFPVIPVFAVSLPALVAIGLLFNRALLNRIRNLPSAFWIIVVWSLVTCAFYVENRTLVQTRYVLVFAAPLTLAVLILVFSFEQKWISYGVCLGVGLAAVGFSVAISWPFIRNKAEHVSKISELAEFIRTRLPPGTPVASYTIGQLAFQSEHPIVDTGGIVNPAVIPFANSLRLRANWARQHGAAYLVGGDDEQPGPRAVLIYESSDHFIGWTLHPRDFNKLMINRLWVLTPPTGSGLV